MMVTEAEYGEGSLKLALIQYLPTFTYYMEILESYLIEYKQILEFYPVEVMCLYPVQRSVFMFTDMQE